MEGEHEYRVRSWFEGRPVLSRPTTDPVEALSHFRYVRKHVRQTGGGRVELERRVGPWAVERHEDVE